MPSRSRDKENNVPQRQRYIVTIKRYPSDGPELFKLVGPQGAGVQIRGTHGMEEQFLAPFRKGAKEVKALAYLRPNGRWHLVRGQKLEVVS